MSECVIFQGTKSDKGYGRVWHNGKMVRAHRLAYETHVGPIPKGMFVCHRCDNPPCINPEHLFLGTTTDNIRDAVAKGRMYSQRKTHCKRGHLLAGENLRPTAANQGIRLCRECINERQRKRKMEARP